MQILFINLIKSFILFSLAVEQEKKESHSIVTWGIGYLVSLVESDVYDEKYKKWVINDLPIIPETMKYWINKSTRQQFNIVKEQLKKGGSDYHSD